MRLRRLQDEAHVCIQLAAAAGRLVTLVYLHPEPVYIHVHASAPLSSFPAYLRRRRSVRFHVTARGGVAEEGPRASLSAAVWTQLPGCDKESRKTERFHTNYGKKMKPSVKGRRKVRLSLVGSENNPSESICKVNRNDQKREVTSLCGQKQIKDDLPVAAAVLFGHQLLAAVLHPPQFSLEQKKRLKLLFFFFLKLRSQ